MPVMIRAEEATIVTLQTTQLKVALLLGKR
jgi:hypothetical protein